MLTPAWRPLAHVRRLRAVALAAALASLAPAPGAAQRLQFRALTPDDGLAASWVQAIVQDPRGFMWFGTVRGLDRYDGYTLRGYRHDVADSTSLGDSRVNALAFDGSGTMWVGTNAGVSRYDRARDRFNNYPVAGQAVQGLVDDGKGTLWLGASNGLHRLELATGRVSAFGGNTPLATTQVNSVIRATDGTIWVGTQGQGAYAIDPRGTVRAFTRATVGLPGMDVRELAQAADGGIWVATYDAGLVRLDPRSGAVTRHLAHDPRDPASLAGNAIYSIFPARSGQGLWVAIENGGLDYLDFATGTFRHNRADANDETGLNNNSAWAVLEDAAGLVWVGTFGGGVNVSKPNSEAIRRYRSVPGDATSLSGNSVLNFAEDARGALWVATDGGGLDRLEPGSRRFARWTTRNSNLNSDAVLDVVVDRDGAPWVATWAGGVSRFDPASGRFTAYTRESGAIADMSVFSLHLDRAGTLWAGTWQQGLARFDRARGRFERIPLAHDGIGEQVIRDIAETRAGELLLSTEGGGLVILDPRTMKREHYFTRTKGPMALPSDQVEGAVEVEPGIVWVATGGGLVRLDRRAGRAERLTRKDGLPSDAIASVVADASGDLWIGTDRGIARLSPGSRDVKLYTTADGMQGSEFNAGAAFAGRDGTLYFGGSKGFNAIRPAAIVVNRQPPKVVLTGFALFNKPAEVGAEGSPLQAAIGETERLRLSHRQSVFTLEFAALDFAAPAKNAYAYRLDGFDEAWNEVGAQRTASYTGLPPGRYTFRVKAANADGTWNEEGLALPLVITPPFWATWWFRLAAIAAMAWGAWSYLAASRRRRLHLEAMNAQLAAAAERDRAAQQYLERNAEEILAGMERFSAGDLTVALPVASDDVMGRLRAGMNHAIANLREMVRQVHEVLDATVAASQEIHASTEELARGADEQQQQTAQVAGAAEQMASTVATNARHIAAAAELAQQSGADAEAGARVVRDAFAGMEGIVGAVGRSAATVERLGQGSEQIANITRVIEQIADQTNLLALNSAIEAARAGVHGRTFRVVAEEIRKLAESTADATDEIRRLIARTRQDVDGAVEAMRVANSRVDADRALVAEASAALDAIVANSERALESIRQVRASSDEQSASTAHIGENIELIARVTSASSAGTQAIATSIEQLSNFVNDLQLRFERFRIEEEGTGVPGGVLPAAGERVAVPGD